MAEKTFEQNMARLEQIVSSLENDEVELQKAMTLFEEGLGLVEKCDKELKNFDETINDILIKHEKSVNNDSAD